MDVIEVLLLVVLNAVIDAILGVVLALYLTATRAGRYSKAALVGWLESDESKPYMDRIAEAARDRLLLTLTSQTEEDVALMADVFTGLTKAADLRMRYEMEAPKEEPKPVLTFVARMAEVQARSLQGFLDAVSGQAEKLQKQLEGAVGTGLEALGIDPDAKDLPFAQKVLLFRASLEKSGQKLDPKLEAMLGRVEMAGLAMELFGGRSSGDGGRVFGPAKKKVGEAGASSFYG